ncbi:mitochondrial intermembrane space import and assembly protein 40-like [Saccostrea echinata]|uniref:mitochondrial intermembrane space import and assembly protein 40-like n=1 Tax=Saccostrea echinata TaxID=191078 RepID=UPI002A81963A|nr:mitochondrial intermembrane space import and assembly protein 40-like [Saccostrea echinata]
MSYCREEGKDGKDRIVFVTREEVSTPSQAMIAQEEEELYDGPTGFVQPNGDLNFGCPCVGGLHAGPCGYEMREFLSCNYYNSKDKEDPRGQGCDEKLDTMMSCIQKHADYYREKMSGDDEEEEDPFTITENEEEEVSSSHIDVTSSIVKDKEETTETGTQS